jgi:VanZ family protein
MTRLTCRAAFIILVASITLLSLVPPALRPVTAAPHSIEHLLIFAVTAAAMALAFSWRWWAQAAGLALFAVAIETAQLFVPGRHARLSDLVVHLFGAGLGLAAVHVACRLNWPASRGDTGPSPTLR